MCYIKFVAKWVYFLHFLPKRIVNFGRRELCNCSQDGKKSYKIMDNILLNKSFVIYRKMFIILYLKMGH